MPPTPPPTVRRDRSEDAAALAETNRAFYNALWDDVRLVGPQHFNTWPLVQRLAGEASCRLEVGPGLRPRLPIAGTHFVDISRPALGELRARGGRTHEGCITALPFADAAFGLVCALDIVEHVEDGGGALAELARVARPGAAVLLSVPLKAQRWTRFDDLVGHHRRYEPEALSAELAEAGLVLEQSAAFGMQPRFAPLVNLGMWWMTHRREQALWYYNRVLMPLGVRFQKPLRLEAGLIDTTRVDEIFLVCRRSG